MNAQTIVKLFIPIALGVIMFGMGLGLSGNDFRRVLRRPRAVALGAIGQLVILPAVGLLCAILFKVPPALGVGLVLVTACPGGPTSNFFSLLAGADVALSVSLTAISGVVTVFTIPIIINLALEFFMGASSTLRLPVLETIGQIIAVVLVPIAAGMLVKRRSEARARWLEAIVKKLSIAILAILIVGAVAKEGPRVLRYVGDVGLAVLALNLSTMLIGFLLARVGKLPRPQAITISLEVGMQNAALAISIALGLLNRTDMAIPAVVYGLWMYIPCLGLVWWARASQKRAKG